MNFNPKWGRQRQADSNLTFSNFWRTDGKRQWLCAYWQSRISEDQWGSVRINEEQWGEVRISEWRLQLPAEQLSFWRMGGRKINPTHTTEVSGRFRRCAIAMSAWRHTSKHIPVTADIISWFRWQEARNFLQNYSRELSDAGICSVRFWPDNCHHMRATERCIIQRAV